MKPLGLSLVTRAPISSALPPCHVGLLRREFIGCGHNLQLPHRKCKKLRLKSHSRYSRFLFKASLDPQSIVVAAAAAAAVAAVTVACFTHFRKQFDIKEAPGRLSLSLSEQPRGTPSWTLTESHTVNFRNDVSNVESKDVHKESRASSIADRDVASEINLMGSKKVPGEVLTPEVSQYQPRMVAPNVHYPLVSNTALTEASSPVTGNDVVPSAVHEQQVLNAAELSFPQIRANLSTAPLAADHINEITDEPVKLRLQTLKDGDISSPGLILRDFVGKELYTINESTLERLDSLEHLSSCATLQKNKSYSSLMKNLLMEGSTVTASNVILPTEKFEGKIHLGYYYSQGIFCQQQDSRNKKEFKKKGKYNFHQEKTQKFSPFSNLKEKDIDNKHNPSWQLRVYNQLLREGR